MHKPHPGRVVLCVCEAGALPTELGVFARVLEMGSHYVAQDTLKMILLTQPFQDRASKTRSTTPVFMLSRQGLLCSRLALNFQEGLNSAPPASQC